MYAQLWRKLDSANTRMDLSRMASSSYNLGCAAYHIVAIGHFYKHSPTVHIHLCSEMSTG